MHTGVRAMQENMVDRGRLQIQVRTEVQNRPIAGARVSISYTGAPGEPWRKYRPMPMVRRKS